MSGGKGPTCQTKPPGLPKANRNSSQSQLLLIRHIVCLSSLRGQAEILPSAEPRVRSPATSSTRRQRKSRGAKRERSLSLG